MNVDWDKLINDVDMASASLEAGNRWGADNERGESYLAKCKDALRSEVSRLSAENQALREAADAVLEYFDFTGGDPDDSDADERATELWNLATAAEELTRAALGATK